MDLISSIVAFFVAVTRGLYMPQFAPLPVVRPLSVQAKTVLTLPLQKLTATKVPPVRAGAFLVIDQESGVVMAESNADLPLPPASTTKMMTALVALENFDLEQVVTVPENIDGVGSKMGLVPGEQIRIVDLLAGLLIHSSNDAAELLASSFSGGQEAFVAAMNKRAKLLGMSRTHYENPSGLSHPNHLSTVRDLLILARFAMRNSTFADLVSRRSAVLTSVDGKIVHEVETTNKLLGEVDGIQGIKTGWTEEAGECLVTQVSREGHTILTALLASPDRFAETKNLISWVYDGWYWETKPLENWQ